MHRLYENDEITVFWDSDKCRHAKECVNGSPDTFDIQRKPWIDVGIAPCTEIWQTVEKCPSGALSITYNHNIRIVFDEVNCRSIAFEGTDRIGECDYQASENGWVIYHTEVDPEYGGKGIAKRLVYAVVQEAEHRKVPIIPTCSYAVRILK